MVVPERSFGSNDFGSMLALVLEAKSAIINNVQGNNLPSYKIQFLDEIFVVEGEVQNVGVHSTVPC